MKQYFLGLLISFTAITGFAQQVNKSDSLPGTNIKAISKPVLVIKGEDIRRFPSANFLDAVNALYPWVYSFNANPNLFLYVVNGNALPDINGISLQDIDEVVFVRGVQNAAVFPLSRLGTFYIRLRKVSSAKPVISFNAQYNFLDKKNLYDPFETSTKLEDNSKVSLGNRQLYHLSVSGAIKKFSYYVSLQQLLSNMPRFSNHTVYQTSSGARDTLDRKTDSSYKNIHALVNLEYKFSPKVSLALLGSYTHASTGSDVEFDNIFHGQPAVSNGRINNYSGGLAFNWQPVSKLSNQLRVEYRNVSASSDYATSFLLVNGPFFSQYYGAEKRKGGDRRWLVEDRLQYQFTSGKLKGTAGVNLSWFHHTAEYNRAGVTSQVVLGSPFPVNYVVLNSYSGSVFSVSPEVNMSVNDVVNIYGSLGVLAKINTLFGSYSGRKINPAAAINFDLKKILKAGNTFSRLELGSSYANTVLNAPLGYWLPDYPGYTAPLIGSLFEYYSQNGKRDMVSNKIFAVNATAGFLNNRLQTTVEWSSFTRKDALALNTNAGVTYVLTTREITGFSFLASASPVVQKDFSWRVSLNFLLPKSKLKSAIFTDNAGYTFQAGMQHVFSIHDFFVQANCMFGSQQYVYTNVGSTTVSENRKLTEVVLNYFAIGYQLKKNAAGKLPPVSFFIHLRNLPGSGKTEAFYNYEKSFGLGLSTTF
ncbi:MAG: hypothetical protein QM791_11020 [Ferruginibacter sp.]